MAYLGWGSGVSRVGSGVSRGGSGVSRVGQWCI